MDNLIMVLRGVQPFARQGDAKASWYFHGSHVLPLHSPLLTTPLALWTAEHVIFTTRARWEFQFLKLLISRFRDHHPCKRSIG